MCVWLCVQRECVQCACVRACVCVCVCVQCVWLCVQRECVQCACMCVCVFVQGCVMCVSSVYGCVCAHACSLEVMRKRLNEVLVCTCSHTQQSFISLILYTFLPLLFHTECSRLTLVMGNSQVLIYMTLCITQRSPH